MITMMRHSGTRLARHKGRKPKTINEKNKNFPSVNLKVKDHLKN
jgi:hypothetical protein